MCGSVSNMIKKKKKKYYKNNDTYNTLTDLSD